MNFRDSDCMVAYSSATFVTIPNGSYYSARNVKVVGHTPER